MKAHPSAVVDRNAWVAEDAVIGPFCYVGPDVTLGEGCVLHPHVSIDGRTTVGRNNVFHANVLVGGPPQDHQPPAEDGAVKIGDDNLFREAVTVHLPKMPGSITRIGSRNRLHFSSHVGHDAEVGDDTLIDSGFALGGHSCVQSRARVGPHGGTHQFATVGKGACVRSHVPVTVDVPPYMEVDGNHYRIIGVHHEAVRGLPPERLLALEDARVEIFESGLPRKTALERLEPGATPEVMEIIEFMRLSMAGRNGRALEAQK